MPPAVIVAAITATMIIGGLSGLNPAIRAARTPPTSALNS
jgi:putative ABC transport system permease protein